MVSVKKQNPNVLISALADELKNIKEISAPEWAAFCKTGNHKQRPPVADDWWQTRAASVLRVVAIKGPIGVSKLRTKYGGRKNRGVKPEAQRKASGNIIRKVLQQLEAAKLVKQVEQGAHKGRAITAEGKALINKVAK